MTLDRLKRKFQVYRRERVPEPRESVKVKWAAAVFFGIRVF